MVRRHRYREEQVQRYAARRACVYLKCLFFKNFDVNKKQTAANTAVCLICDNVFILNTAAVARKPFRRGVCAHR